ncbi:MAG TPA: hypothetical protein VK419_10475 [Bryobacteraceae bacterium]|nr:hypothetical protein [Bryobacteraceae bacterium]
MREQIEEQNRQWRLFHEWEATLALEDRDASRLEHRARAKKLA